MPKKKDNEKSPYGNLTIEEVVEVEKGTYVIQVGHEFFALPNGKWAFSKERADHYYLDILEGFTHMKKHGSKEEKSMASQCLLLLKIYPLRIQ